MATINITVQSLLNTAVYDLQIVDTAGTIGDLKTAMETNFSYSATWFDLVFNESVLDTAQTIGSYGIVEGSQLRIHNKIGRLANKELRQKAKLSLAALDRASSNAGASARYEYDITELPTQYSGNTLINNLNEGGLQLGRPWVSFLPTDLFASGEQGVYFDPSDITTLFQDSAGTIPVTTAGDPVGKILDKSGRGNHATQSTAGKRPTWQVDPYGYGYLAFDGVDDFMATGAINLTGTAKVTASVGCLVDDTKVTAGTAICTGGDPNATNGTFLIGAPSSTADHNFYLRGTTTIKATMPNAVVGADILTGVFDIGQATKELELIPRLSGNVSTSITWTGTNAGTGNFGNQPLYIGSLGGTGTFFKGHIYSIESSKKRANISGVLEYRALFPIP